MRKIAIVGAGAAGSTTIWSGSLRVFVGKFTAARPSTGYAFRSIVESSKSPAETVYPNAIRTTPTSITVPATAPRRAPLSLKKR